MERIDKTNYYLDVAQTIAQRATCLRRKYGAVIVKDDEIVSTGYNGSPRGAKNCTDIGLCKRKEQGIKPGERYELCRSIHAEQNAIICASRREMQGATLYLVGLEAETNELTEFTEPCIMCKRAIINAGIDNVVMRKPDGSFEVTNTGVWLLMDEV